VSKSLDEKVTTDLIETLEDGKKGFLAAAEKLVDTTRSDLAPQFREHAEQRGRFSAELEVLAATYGDDIDEDGSVAAAAHRGWMALKDLLAGSDPDGVLDVAAKGEEHAVAEYIKALDEDISPNLREIVARQFAEIKTVAASVQALQAAHGD